MSINRGFELKKNLLKDVKRSTFWVFNQKQVCQGLNIEFKNRNNNTPFWKDCSEKKNVEPYD